MIRNSTRSALVIVDFQNDFRPGGALAVPDGDEIVKPLQAAAKQADLVVCSRDWHPSNHCSFKPKGPWPIHCVQRTPGAQIPVRIRRLAKYVVSKGVDPNLEGYSAFAGGTLRPERSLREILENEDIGIVVVGGLAFDVCVKHTALDANALAFQTIAPLNLSRALTPEGQRDTEEALRLRGILVPDQWTT